MAGCRILRGMSATAQGVYKANGGASGLCGRRLFDFSLLPALRPNVGINLFSTSPQCKSSEWKKTSKDGGGGGIALDEVKRILRLAKVEALKKRLEADGNEFITHIELLKMCRSMRVVQSDEEAAGFVKALDAAGVFLIFRNKVYIYPDKVAELVMSALPLALAPEDDSKRQELERLQKEKEEIDKIAHRYVRIVLWTGLCCLSMQISLFFCLTFWELSWAVMGPIAFFTPTCKLILAYMYFLITSRDPSYQDVITKLFLYKQKKLYKKRKFDVDRFLELQKHCKPPLDWKNGEEAVIAELVMNALPLALAPEDDTRRQELERLQKEKEEIDKIAHRHARIVLSTGLCGLSFKIALVFRLTYWDLSFDVVEPVVYMWTITGLLVSYTYFLITSSNPSHQDVMKRLFLCKQKKLYKKRKFDVDRFLELQKHCKSPRDCRSGEKTVLGD